MKLNSNYLKKIGIVLILIISFAFIYYFNLTHYLSFPWIKQHRDFLMQYVVDHYSRSVFLYISFYIIATALALPATFILTMIGGFLFGVLHGMLYVNIGATCGATIAFLISRYLLREWIQRRYHDQFLLLNNELKKYGYIYLLGMRCIIFLPFFIANIVAGITRVSVWNFIWTTSIGIIPIGLLYVYAGRQFAYINSIDDVMSWRTMSALIIISILLLLSLAVRIKQKEK